MAETIIPSWYEIIVSNIGRVAQGNNAFKANSVYATYVKMSKENYGRVAGETVTMFRNGEIVKEYTGALHQVED